MNNEKYCLFCLDIIPNSEFREIEIDFGCSCKINYHNECMDIWLSSHRFASCPLCRNRQPIDNNITIETKRIISLEIFTIGKKVCFINTLLKTSIRLV